MPHLTQTRHGYGLDSTWGLPIRNASKVIGKTNSNIARFNTD